MSGPQSDKPEDRLPDERRDKPGQPESAPPGTAVGGFPEPPGPEATDRNLPPHHSLSHPVGEPDPDQDIEAGETNPPHRDRIDE